MGKLRRVNHSLQKPGSLHSSEMGGKESSTELSLPNKRQISCTLVDSRGCFIIASQKTEIIWVTRLQNLQFKQEGRSNNRHRGCCHCNASHPWLHDHAQGLKCPRCNRDADHVVDERKQEVDVDSSDCYAGKINCHGDVHQIALKITNR